MKHHHLHLRGLRLHHVEAGAGEPVLLLHGFPECWYSWRHQLPALAAAGYRALALDLPGYNDSDKPAMLSRYRARMLTDDLASFLHQVAGGPAFVVGHDWGGVLAWRLAARYPELVRKLAVLNAPHPAAFRAELFCNPLQWLRSTYMLVFQIRDLAEWLLSAGDFALLERAWRTEPIHPGAFSKTDIAAYKHALNRPGGLTGPLNYYRAILRYSADIFGPPQLIETPTLVIWGERDRYLSARLPDRMEPWVPNLRVERIADASHWVQNDVPGRVNELLTEWFGKGAQNRNGGDTADTTHDRML